MAETSAASSSTTAGAVQSQFRGGQHPVSGNKHHHHHHHHGHHAHHHRANSTSSSSAGVSSNIPQQARHNVVNKHVNPMVVDPTRPSSSHHRESKLGVLQRLVHVASCFVHLQGKSPPPPARPFPRSCRSIQTKWRTCQPWPRYSLNSSLASAII